MTKSEFEKAYEGVIPKGKLCQVSIGKAKTLGLDKSTQYDTSHDASFLDIETNTAYRFGSFKHAHFAGYAEDLINAYQAGELVWKED